MTDFAKLTGQPPVIDESLEAFEFSPEGFENGSGQPLSLTMHPANGTRFKRVMRMIQIKAKRQQGAEDDITAVDDEALLKTLKEQDNRTSEALARCCDGWNMTDGKKPIPLTIENATALFEQVETLRMAVDEKITEVGNAKKAKKSA